MKGIISLIFGILAVISGTLSLIIPSVICAILTLVFWVIGMGVGSRAWTGGKQIIASAGFFLSFIGFTEAIIYAKTNLW
jgi:hypothetical protein